MASQRVWLFQLQSGKMFAKLKKKLAEEAAIAPRPGAAARIPRSVSRESIASGADSGDDFVSCSLLLFDFSYSIRSYTDNHFKSCV